MIAIDSNVLLRHLYQRDDPAQSRIANRVIGDASAAGEPIFVTVIALVETLWVLRQGYGLERARLLEVLDALSAEPGFLFEHAELVYASIDAFRRGRADFADLLLGRIGQEAGAAATYTFDRALRHVPGFTWLSSTAH
jgi:predicted nucleic-acid-binding protein